MMKMRRALAILSIAASVGAVVLAFQVSPQPAPAEPIRPQIVTIVVVTIPPFEILPIKATPIPLITSIPILEPFVPPPPEPHGHTVLTFAVVDEAGNRVEGVACTFSIVGPEGTDASLSSETGITDANGNVSVTLTAGSTVETVQMKADCGDFGAFVQDVTVSLPLPTATPTPTSTPTDTPTSTNTPPPTPTNTPTPTPVPPTPIGGIGVFPEVPGDGADAGAAAFSLPQTGAGSNASGRAAVLTWLPGGAVAGALALGAVWYAGRRRG